MNFEAEAPCPTPRVESGVEPKYVETRGGHQDRHVYISLISKYPQVIEEPFPSCMNFPWDLWLSLVKSACFLFFFAPVAL